MFIQEGKQPGSRRADRAQAQARRAPDLPEREPSSHPGGFNASGVITKEKTW